MADSNRYTSNIPDNSPENRGISQPTSLQSANIYSVAALARLLGISKQALAQRIQSDSLPSNIQPVHIRGRLFLSYQPPL